MNIDWVENFEYIGMFLAGIGFFIPSAIIALVVGALKDSNFFELALIGGLGGVFGASILYLLGYCFRNKNILKYIKGKGKFLGISEKSYIETYDHITKRGLLYVFISRSLPLVREAASIIVGYLRYNFIIVLVVTFLGTVAYLYVLEYIGFVVGLSLEDIQKATTILNISMLSLLCVVVFVYLYIRRKKNSK